MASGTVDSQLRSALDRRLARLPRETDAFRWVDFELEDLTVDLFGDVAVASTYRVRTSGEELELAEALTRVRPLRAVYWKRRPKEARRAANEASDEVAPPLPLVGAPVETLVCTELGARFEIRPANGLNVGLYLDARDARAWVQEHSRSAAVLNLFSYTCGFGVAALRGGATRAVNVDTSRKVLDWGEANLRLNGFTPDRRDFISGDALEWLPRLAKKGDRFGGVVLDPPSFASAGKKRWVASAQYPRLVERAAECLEANGWLLACCNLSQWSPSQFEAEVRDGLERAGRKAKIERRFGASPIDFAPPSMLKAIALRVS